MTKTLPVLLAGLMLASAGPLTAEWVLESSWSFAADRKRQFHPCCATSAVLLEDFQTPAVLCVFYANNLRKGDEGWVMVRTWVIGLETGIVSPEWRVSGAVQESFWGECAQLGSLGEPCLIESKYNLSSFPRMKKRRRDGFTAGVLVIPGRAGLASVEALERSLRERVSGLLTERPTGERRE